MQTQFPLRHCRCLRCEALRAIAWFLTQFDIKGIPSPLLLVLSAHAYTPASAMSSMHVPAYMPLRLFRVQVQKFRPDAQFETCSTLYVISCQKILRQKCIISC
jgi:hypothetical protein